ncbi:hypothetical protein VTN77DRAFT_7382 [Rasamsonia byssochlamydoides]|uniref:uncharacterized protein n=1 Tax=Rasamsonia byssochlamydoides TaxID=89139 RepID=UPI00374361EB
MQLPSRVAVTVLASLIGPAIVAASEFDSWLALHPISTRTRTSSATTPTLSANGVLQSNPALLTSVRNPCPASCSDSGSNPSNWTVYHNMDRLAWCNQTMLLDFALYNALDDPDTHKSIRSCTANGVNTPAKNDGSCPLTKDKAQTQQVSASLQMAWLDSSDTGSVTDVVAAFQQIESYLGREASCNETIAFTYSGQAAVGVYAGSQIQWQGITTSVLQQFISQVQSKGISDSLLVQLCGGDGRSARYALGVIANANADLAFVQSAVQT